MKYTLKSGLASYEGEQMGEKTYYYPAGRKGVELALKEALEELAENNKLIEVLADISSMCIGDIAMGYKMDANAVGEMIYAATGLTNSELNDYNCEAQIDKQQ